MTRFVLGLLVGMALARLAPGLPAHCRAMMARCAGAIADVRA